MRIRHKLKEQFVVRKDMDVNSKEYCAIAGWGPFYTHFRV
jgi:hypothetical protein